MSNSVKPIVVFDIDGTLADTTHRLYHLKPPEGQKKNWPAFFAEAKHDKPIRHISNLNRMYYEAGYEIILCTGRPANLRNDTRDWLEKNDIMYGTLLMRLTNDRGADSEVKPRILAEYLAKIHCSLKDVEVMYEDRLHVAEAFRKIGVPVLIVGDEWRS